MIFLQELIRERIQQLTRLGYIPVFHHWVLQPFEKMVMKAGNDIYILADATENVRVESDTGLYELFTGKTNEQIYEHSGTINIENLSNLSNQIPFIQFTEKNITNATH